MPYKDEARQGVEELRAEETETGAKLYKAVLLKDVNDMLELADAPFHFKLTPVTDTQSCLSLFQLRQGKTAPVVAGVVEVPGVPNHS